VKLIKNGIDTVSFSCFPCKADRLKEAFITLLNISKKAALETYFYCL